MRLVQRIGVTVMAAGMTATLLAGCGSSSGGGTSPTAGGGTSPTAGGATAAATGTPVTATEKEFSISLGKTGLTAGTYTFTIQNQGKFPHNLNVKGPGVDGQVSPVVQPGASGQLTVTLQKGSYELWCSIDSHKDRGMDMTITVG